MAHITGNELALAGIAGTLISGFGASLLASRTQKRSTDKTVKAQADLAIQAYRDAAQAEIGRENRAHKRAEYMSIIKQMLELKHGLTYLNYLKATPRLGSGSSETGSWRVFQAERLSIVIDTQALATTNGSNELREQVAILGRELVKMFERMQTDQDEAIDRVEDEGRGDTESTAGAVTNSLRSGFPAVIRDVVAQADEIVELTRREIGLSQHHD